MAGFDGNGNYIRSYLWVNDAANGIDITASRVDTEMNGEAAALSICVTRDGQGKMGADFMPNGAGTLNIGSAPIPWLAAYFTTVNATTATLTTVNATTLNGALQIVRSAAEIAAGVTPVNYSYAPGDVRRYGADPTGVADSATALLNASKCNGAVYIPDGTFKVASQVTITNANVYFYGNGRSSILQASAASFNLFEVRANDVMFDKLAFYGAAVDATTTQFGIFTQQSFAPLRLWVYRCYFGGSGASLRLNNAVKYDAGCHEGRVIGCYIDQMMGTVSGNGYGVLAGAVNDLTCVANKVLGSSGRGRHAFYLSTGAQYCIIADNQTDSLNLEHITLNASISQAANAYNVIANNVMRGGVTGATTGHFSLFGLATGNKIMGNISISSGSKGFFLNAANPGGDCACLDNELINNRVIAAQDIGIDISGTTRTFLQGNSVRESSQSSAGVLPNIRLVSTANFGGAGTAVVDCVLLANNCSGTTFARSSLQLNTTTPVPTGTYLSGNRFPVCNLTDVELNSIPVVGVTQQVGAIAKRIAATYSASITLEASFGNEFDITATNGTAFTINAPSNPVDGQAITLTIANASGGVLGAITWNGVFKMSAWTNPANGQNRSITFKYNASNWQQINQTGVDIPN